MPDQRFTDDSMLRRVIREQVVGLSGPRALLMQAAHPVAFAGLEISCARVTTPCCDVASSAT
ncbi:MAG: hypothetical protein M3P44_04305 [Actinomycetota bacterium]|nr:hypothetical protein [Actinomycetota bacterium]